MRRLLLITAMACAAVGMSADSPLSVRADRAYRSGEWAQAQALYMLVVDSDSADAAAYGRAIVSAAMRADTAAIVPTFRKGMERGVAMDSILNVVARGTRRQGKGSIYASTLTHIAEAMPWMRRPVDARMLDYHRFRRDAAATEMCARRLLAGGDDTRWYNALAWACADTGRMAEAIEAWKRVLDMDPDNVEALTAIANAIAEEHPDEAVKLLQRADSIQPTPYIHTLIRQIRQ